MRKINILWADDEIDLLKPHIMFLEEKGYGVVTSTNGREALELAGSRPFDIIFLDENMPGLSGIATLERLRTMQPAVPVVMITKNEDESVMEEAIGSRIADYLIKPVNPNQILLSIKKNLDEKRLVSEKVTTSYQQEFRNIGMTLGDNLDHKDWTDVYKRLTYWELELEQSEGREMDEVLHMQKVEANALFAKFIARNYTGWLAGAGGQTPVLSHTLLQKNVFPLLKQGCSVFLFVIDNLRYDQWRTIQPVVNHMFLTESEDMYYSILPTATQYARNALFAGLMPSEIAAKYPKLWVNEDEEEGKNMHEEELLAENLRRNGLTVKSSYNKITTLEKGKKLAESAANLMGNSLNVVVYNFVDMLSHARTDMEVIRELASDEAAYRSLTLSWFEHSPLLDVMKLVAAKNDRNMKIVITSDHGTIRVKNPSKVIGDRNTSTNLRYKQGKNLRYDQKEVFELPDPSAGFLPRHHVSSRFIFAKEDRFFAYPNNYNYYVNYYRNTFQHGGISLEEILVPFAVLAVK